MSYTPTYIRPYEQWKELPSKETLVTAEVLTQYDDTFEHIEEYLESEGEKEYALVTEAGYSIVASIDEYYVLTVVLKNKAGDVLSTSEPIDLPIESMIINVDYDEESGILTFSLQNGQTLDVNISTLIRGLVPTSRKIAGVDLEDDITAEELKTALGVFDSTVTAGELKPWLYDTENEVVIGVYNGKPVYRKYFTIHVTTTNGLYTQAITDLIPDYEEILNHKMYTTSGNLLNAIYANQGTLDTQDWMCYFVNVGGNIISISRSTSQPELDNDFSFMAEYTKTTDAEGSGNNLNPYGIYDAKLDEVKADIEKANSDIEELQNAIVTTDSTTLSNSHTGRVLFNEIIGGMEQEENPSTDSPQPINGSVISGIRVHRKNFFDYDNYPLDTSETMSVRIFANQTFSVGLLSVSGNSQTNIRLDYADGKSIDYSICSKNVTNDNQWVTKTFVEEKDIVGIRFYNAGISSGEYTARVIDKILVRLGEYSTTTDEDWEPYQSKEIALSQPITLYNDVLSPQNVERKYYKQVFSGSENITETETYFQIPLLKASLSTTVLCNISLTARTTTNYVRIGKHNMTLDEFKAYLISNYENGTPAYIVYPLAESVIEELPTIDRIALNSLPSYDGITYVEFIDVGIQPSVSIDYGTSKVGGMTLESLLTARNNDLRLSSLEASVVNNI